MDQPLPPYKGDGSYVFVCYSHEDSADVYPEIRRLQDQGIQVWYDEGISPGEEWPEELGQAIAGAQRLLFFVSPNSVGSRNCRDEVHYAHHHDTPILAVHLVETELPAGLELAFGSSQAILKARVEDVSCLPHPIQARLPIWVGGTGEKRTLRIAARHADGWNAAYVSPKEFGRLSGVLDRWCEQEARDPNEIQRSVNLSFAMGSDTTSAEGDNSAFLRA